MVFVAKIWWSSISCSFLIVTFLKVFVAQASLHYLNRTKFSIFFIPYRIMSKSFETFSVTFKWTHFKNCLHVKVLYPKPKASMLIGSPSSNFFRFCGVSNPRVNFGFEYVHEFKTKFKKNGYESGIHIHMGPIHEKTRDWNLVLLFLQ